MQILELGHVDGLQKVHLAALAMADDEAADMLALFGCEVVERL